jgi:alkaline phosphatase D
MGAAVAAGTLPLPVLGQTAPAAVTPDAARPALPYGVQSGDVTRDRAIVWGRADRPARMVVEWSTSDAFRDARRVLGPATLDESDFTARVELRRLPAGQQIFYRVAFEDLASPRVASVPVVGSFRSAPAGRRDVTFVWSGDTAGQGWGINREWGGMKIYEQMRRLSPDFFVHSGDQIYADGPIVAEVKLDDGTLWRNVTMPEKAKVAETLREFRGNFAYNLLDEHVRRFNAEVPSIVQWDDHETRNNWYPGQMIGDPRYTMKSASLLAARARRAMFEYNPMRFVPEDPDRIYRAFTYGPSLEVFVIDERSHRGPNTANRQDRLDAESAFLGTETEIDPQSGRGTNSLSSPGTRGNRPSLQSRFACSMRDFELETKFQSMYRGPSRGAPPSMTIRASDSARMVTFEPGTNASIRPAPVRSVPIPMAPSIT